MSKLIKARRLLACGPVCAGLFFGTVGRVVACLIPVFQYATENWPADPHRLVLAAPAEAPGLALLERAQGAGANIEIELDEAAADRARLRAYYPLRTGLREPWWSGELTEQSAVTLLESPARREIIRRLLERKVAVWVMLESGDRSRDRQTWKMLEEETRNLKQTLRVILPEDDVDASGIQTDIDFALVRVKRTNPEEKLLVEMLLGMEPDLRDFEGQPMVFPIYGRGLVLYALVGAGINPRTLREAAEFLTGPCSCQIKSANPGLDLLLSQDWESVVERHRSHLRRHGHRQPGGVGDFVACA
ncbi:MAG: hypothetical protein LC725_12530 [Lentisphaerae bacterium]|nr:hypothetical protein [Lentisphaerota bacterium]